MVRKIQEFISWGNYPEALEEISVLDPKYEFLGQCYRTLILFLRGNVKRWITSC